LGLSQLNGSLGVGGIAAPPLAVHEVMEGVETKRQIDKLWMMSTVRCRKGRGYRVGTRTTARLISYAIEGELKKP
jgi:hypothetical protein